MLTRRDVVQAGIGAAWVMLGLAGCQRQVPSETPTAFVALIPGESLYEVTYYCGGGEEGDTESLKLTRRPDGGAVLEHRSRTSWNAEEKAEDYQLDASAFDELERIVMSYDMRLASERPESDTVALDAPTKSITFAFVGEGDELALDPDQTFTISETQELAEDEREGFQAAHAALVALIP